MTLNISDRYFDWYKNFNYLKIIKLDNFRLADEFKIFCDIIFYFDYFEQAPVILFDDNNNNDINENNKSTNHSYTTTTYHFNVKSQNFKENLEYLMNPCDWYVIKILKLNYLYY